MINQEPIKLIKPWDDATCFFDVLNLNLSHVHLTHPDPDGEAVVTLRFRENIEKQWLKAGIRQGRSEVFDSLRHWDR